MNKDKSLRQSIVVYRSFADAIKAVRKEVDPDDLVSLLIGIYDFGLDMVEPNFKNPVCKALWLQMRPQLLANIRKYNNGCKGGAPKGSKNNPNGRKGKTNQELTKNKPKTNAMYNVKCKMNNDNEECKINNDNENEHKEESLCKTKTRSKRFVKPTIEEITSYIKSGGFDVDPKRFYNYYESVGWKVGKTQKPMENWKAAVLTWKEPVDYKKKETGMEVGRKLHERPNYTEGW